MDQLLWSVLPVGSLPDLTAHRRLSGAMGRSEVQVLAQAQDAGHPPAATHRTPPDRTVCSLAPALWTRPNNGSRMTRECHVRFCESAGVRSPRATHLVFGFEHEADARRFLDAMRARLEAFALSAPPGQDPNHRVWPPCGGRSRGSRSRQTGDFQLPAFHLHLRQIAEGQVPDPQDIPPGPRAGETQRGERRTANAHAPAAAGNRQVAGAGRANFMNYHAVPTNSRAVDGFRELRALALVPRRSAARRPGQDRLEPDHAVRRPPPPRSAYPSTPRQRSALPSDTRGGAVCEKVARTVLCGGRAVMRVPTATRRGIGSPRRQQLGRQPRSP